jgi:hypothetical protein
VNSSFGLTLTRRGQSDILYCITIPIDLIGIWEPLRSAP